MKVEYSILKIYLLLVPIWIGVAFQLESLLQGALILVGSLFFAWGIADSYNFHINDEGLCKNPSFATKTYKWTEVQGIYKFPFIKGHYYLLMKKPLVSNFLAGFQALPTIFMKDKLAFINYIKEHQEELIKTS